MVRMIKLRINKGLGLCCMNRSILKIKKIIAANKNVILSSSCKKLITAL